MTHNLFGRYGLVIGFTNDKEHILGMCLANITDERGSTQERPSSILTFPNADMAQAVAGSIYESSPDWEWSMVTDTKRSWYVRPVRVWAVEFTNDEEPYYIKLDDGFAWSKEDNE